MMTLIIEIQQEQSVVDGILQYPLTVIDRRQSEAGIGTDQDIELARIHLVDGLPGIDTVITVIRGPSHRSEQVLVPSR